MRILDATCGLREMWFEKNYPDCIYVDLRPEVKPDIVADMTRSPFLPNSFDLIVFDPPHRSSGQKTIWKETYGIFNTAEIMNFCAQAFLEFHRILKRDGLIMFKWNTHDISLKRIMALVPAGFDILFGQHTAFRTKHASSTYWFCIRRKYE